MSKIVSIATAVPQFKHEQNDIMSFMQKVYALPEAEHRKLRFLYRQSGIESRYSVIADYSKPLPEWKFYPQTENLEPFPSLEQRMTWYNRYAAPLSVDAIRKCLDHRTSNEITHLITVSCTGMSAPGLDLHVIELMDLPRNIQRTSVNFMGCYAAIHAMKMGDAICSADKDAKVLIVCTELCTLHFQREPSFDNFASSLLFADGAAAILMVADETAGPGVKLGKFYSEIIPKGKKDMSWELSSTGFLMTLSGYVPDIIEEDINGMVERALDKNGLDQSDITDWCIHPGGKRILEAVEHSLEINSTALAPSYNVLKQYGNMSSPTILFVLKEILQKISFEQEHKIMGIAFGPGLTLETFTAESVSS